MLENALKSVKEAEEKAAILQCSEADATSSRHSRRSQGKSKRHEGRNRSKIRPESQEAEEEAHKASETKPERGRRTGTEGSGCFETAGGTEARRGRRGRHYIIGVD